MNQEIHPVTLDELFATIDELVPASKEQPTNTTESTTQQAKPVDMSFNLTKSIQEKLNTLAPTVVLTEYKEVFLSANEVKSLMPVPDHTLLQLLLLFAGKGTTAHMLDGALLAHTADGDYIKILPEIDKKDGYANYKFTAINYKILNRLIDKYCELLQCTPKYEALFGYYKDPGEVFFGIKSEYNYDDVDHTDIVDDTGFDNPFSTSIIKATTAKAKSNITDDADGDAYTLQTLNTMLKARMQSSKQHLSFKLTSERLASQVCLYAEDMELLEYLKTVVNRVYKDIECNYHIPYTLYFDPPYRLSGHYLSKWVYDPVEYTAKITNGGGAYQVDHENKNRSDNSPGNLSIKPTKYNKGRTNRSIEVHYKGDDYVSLSTYCDETNAGSYDTLLNLKDNLQPGDSKEYNHRIYTKVNENQLTVTDAESKASEITFNGESYSNLKAFADELKFTKRDYDALRQGIGRARKDGKTKYTYRHKGKKYTFYLDANGDTKITV
jgi:hypothetical protein